MVELQAPSFIVLQKFCSQPWFPNVSQICKISLMDPFEAKPPGHPWPLAWCLCPKLKPCSCATLNFYKHPQSTGCKDLTSKAVYSVPDEHPSTYHIYHLCVSFATLLSCGLSNSLPNLSSNRPNLHRVSVEISQHKAPPKHPSTSS